MIVFYSSTFFRQLFASDWNTFLSFAPIDWFPFNDDNEMLSYLLLVFFRVNTLCLMIINLPSFNDSNWLFLLFSFYCSSQHFLSASRVSSKTTAQRWIITHRSLTHISHTFQFQKKKLLSMIDSVPSNKVSESSNDYSPLSRA